MSLRDQILSRKPRLKAVEVPEWETTVHIKAFTLKELLGLNGKDLDSLEVLSTILISSLCDEGGTLIFTEADIPELTEKLGREASKLVDEIIAFNGIDLKPSEIADRGNESGQALTIFSPTS